MFLLFTGGSGKHRPKEPKKKNKQRLRFRAQNQHSDHLASARSSQWGQEPTDFPFKRKRRKYKAKLLATAAATIFWLTWTVPTPQPPNLPQLPSRTLLHHHYKKIIFCIISASAHYTHASRLLLPVPLLWSASGPLSPAPCLALWTFSPTETHFPSLTVLLSCASMEDEGANRDCGGGGAEWTDG